MKNRKICLVGAHGTGKSTICKKIHKACYVDYSINVMLIPEQFREVVKDIPNFKRQTEEITSATYGIQLYFENLYTAQGKNILCDRSIIDTFIYYNYFNPKYTFDEGMFFGPYKLEIENDGYGYDYFLDLLESANQYTQNTYSKIYLIEPSDREIEDDGFRMTDKKQQLEVHKLFLEYFKHLDNVEIVNQEDAHKEEFINKVVSKFIF